MAATTKTEVTPGDFLPFRDLTKTLEQFKVAGADASSFVEARRKDVAASPPPTRSPTRPWRRWRVRRRTC